MFGHTARVWKSVIRNDALITIGEVNIVPYLLCNVQ